MAKGGTTIRRTGVRAWREASGLSRMDLIRRLSIPLDPGTLYRIETGKNRTTTVEIAMALADALTEAVGKEVTVYDLFPRTSGPELMDAIVRVA